MGETVVCHLVRRFYLVVERVTFSPVFRVAMWYGHGGYKMLISKHDDLNIKNRD